MEPEVRDAVFGNVGAIISFRVGAEDATALTKYFEPQFESQDLIQLHNRAFIASLSIDGEKAPAFSATTMPLPDIPSNYSQDIINNSRLRYSASRSEVEEQVAIASAPKFTGVQQKSEHNTNAKSKPNHNRTKPNNQKSTTDRPKKKKAKSDHNRSAQNKNKHKPEKNNDGTMKHDETIQLR